MASGQTAMKGVEVSRTVRTVRHADITIDTNVISRAADDLTYFRRLVGLLDRICGYEGVGRIYLSTTAFLEVLQTVAPSRLMLLLDTLLRLVNQLHTYGLNMLAPLPRVLQDEWRHSPAIAMEPIANLADALREAIRRGSIDHTWLSDISSEYLRWKNIQRQAFRPDSAAWQSEFASNQAFRNEVMSTVRNLRPPTAYTACDDVVQRLVEAFSLPGTVEDPKRMPAGYPSTWSYALLVRLSQFAQTIPPAVRQAEFSDLDLVLRADKNDLADAEIASCAAGCGMMLTEDPRLLERLNFLHDRGLARTQAFTMEALHQAWPHAATAPG